MANAQYEKAQELFRVLTDKLIARIEDAAVSGDDWKLPWHFSGGATIMTPRNALTRESYKGGNVIQFWIEAEDKGYTSGWFATYKQWKALGAQVREGEKATYGIKWSVVPDRKAKALDPDTTKTALIPATFAVFNASQVDGWVQPEVPTGPDAIEHAETFFDSIGARVSMADHAYYMPIGDFIGIPPLHDFKDAESYYATLGHESVHWTSHASRLNRELGKRFGDDAYAAEELVAELGAAFLSAHLGLANEPREDHAMYLKHWLRVLKSDVKALWKASSLAQEAVNYLIDASGENVDDDDVALVEVAA